MTELWYCYGGYRMRIQFYKGRERYAQVTMYFMGELRFPMLWSRPMTWEQANGAKELFNQIGYFDMPV